MKQPTTGATQMEDKFWDSDKVFSLIVTFLCIIITLAAGYFGYLPVYARNLDPILQSIVSLESRVSNLERGCSE